eukprot:16476-Heterococcus_DN1.PRE.1
MLRLLSYRGSSVRLIHDFLGAGHYAFIAPVSKLWKQSYEATPSLKAFGYGRERTKMSILCNSKTTLFSSVFTSTSRVHMAKELQRQPPRVLVWALALAAGRFAELSVLQYALSINLFRFSSHSVGIARRSLCEGAALA